MYACDICQKPGFSSRHSVNQHRYSFHPNEKHLAKRLNKVVWDIVCPFCGEVFDSLEELKSHFKECDYDEEDTVLPPPTTEELKDYQKPGDNYFCEECPQSLRTLEDLYYHNYQSHPTCLKCRVPWSNTREYDMHVKKCKAELDPNNLQRRNEAECPICRQVEYNLYQLKRHLESEHNIRKRVIGM